MWSKSHWIQVNSPVSISKSKILKSSFKSYCKGTTAFKFLIWIYFLLHNRYDNVFKNNKIISPLDGINLTLLNSLSLTKLHLQKNIGGYCQRITSSLQLQILKKLELIMSYKYVIIFVYQIMFCFNIL